jgi:hypothetical protein
MQDDQARLLAGPRQDLARAREDSSTWAELAFATEPVDDGRVIDRNRAARFGVLWAAQYDRRPADLPLLRFVLEQEILRYQQTAVFGMAPDLELAGLLVAEHRQVQDVWLHWRAKNISFDTALGYHTYYLLTAGVAATLAEIRASSHADRDRVLKVVGGSHDGDGTTYFTDADVQDWLDQRQASFPATPDAESLRVWANHAARLGEPEISRRFLLRWAHGQPRTEHLLNILQFHLAELGFLAEAIEIQTEAATVREPGWPKASSLLRLFDLHRQADDFTAAWQTLQDCAPTMPADWKNAGLWRYFVRNHFLLVPMAPDPQTALELLHEGDRQMRGATGLWMDGVLDAALAATEYTGHADLRDRYLALQQAETRARDEALSDARRPDDRTTDSQPPPDTN